VATIRARLCEDERTRAWIEHLEGIGEPTVEISLPTADDLPPILLKLTVPHEDINDVVAMMPSRERSPEAWWLLERSVQVLVRTMGANDWPPNFPALSEDMGSWRRYFYVYVFLAALPHVRAFHRAREIPDETSWRTLADLGRNMAVHRWRHGVGGLHSPSWLRQHFHGAIYDLGRLQFERITLDARIGEAIRAAGLPCRPGDPTLSVHIPEFSGPLTPSMCDASFARAKNFFTRHFPEERYEVAICDSWLLDKQLAEYLPGDANILRFQRRFQPAYRPDDDDEAILEFVFGRATIALDKLPRRTTLERAIVAHLKAGRHWHGGVGWLRL
jgi:hypothetical protein